MKACPLVLLKGIVLVTGASSGIGAATALLAGDKSMPCA